jgi:ABC-2 type transport system permease protein
MSVIAQAPPAVRHRSALVQLIITEFKLFLREPTGPGFGVALPVVLLVIFGNIPFYTRGRGSLGGLSLLDVYVPILIALAIAVLSLNVLPPVLSTYREKGVLRRLETTPVGPVRVLVAQLAISLSAVLITLILILAIGRLAFSVVLPRQLAGFVLAALLGAAALMSIGLFVAAAAPSSRTANALGAIIFYPMVFFAGLFFPIPEMPATLQHISHATPLGAVVEALQYASQGNWPHPQQWLTLAAYAVGFSLAAAKLFRWE